MICPSCKHGVFVDFLNGPIKCQHCDGHGYRKDDYEDRVLLGLWGPVRVVLGGKDNTALGVEISHTGSISVYGPYENAAEHLELDGLLIDEGPARNTIGKSYAFTERGKIARWAIVEAFNKSLTPKHGSYNI